MRIINKIVAFLFLFINTIVFSQTPGFNYQALILNNTEIQIPGTDVAKNKIPLGLEDVVLRFSITNSDDNIQYIEEQTVRTDENGMVSVIVGEGTPIISAFKEINWDGKLKFLNVEIDILNDKEGFIFLDSQKILYIPHPTKGSNVVIVDDSTNLNPANNKGDLIWVKNYDKKNNPTLIIWDETKWVPVTNDYDPTNELGLVVVTDITDRSNKFPKPIIGDQVWNQSCSCIEVYNGSEWATINISNASNAHNGLYKFGSKIRLGGLLIEPTELITSSNNTLSIKELEESNQADDEIIRVEKNTGILRKSSASSIIKQEEAVFFASDGQIHFPTPIPITDPKKIDVYRNGVKIDFIAINTTTIELEEEAICYENDKIRIVQLR